MSKTASKARARSSIKKRRERDVAFVKSSRDRMLKAYVLIDSVFATLPMNTDTTRDVRDICANIIKKLAAQYKNEKEVEDCIEQIELPSVEEASNVAE